MRVLLSCPRVFAAGVQCIYIHYVFYFVLKISTSNFQLFQFIHIYVSENFSHADFQVKSHNGLYNCASFCY
jgi:hypothetical protein